MATHWNKLKLDVKIKEWIVPSLSRKIFITTENFEVNKTNSTSKVKKMPINWLIPPTKSVAYTALKARRYTRDWKIKLGFVCVKGYHQLFDR